MEVCETPFFFSFFASFEMTSWVFFILWKCGILHWFLKVKLNLNIWDKPYLLVIHYYPVILLNSIFVTIFMWVGGLQFSFLFTSFFGYGIKAILLHGKRWGVFLPVLWSLYITGITYHLMNGRNHQWGHLGL